MEVHAVEAVTQPAAADGQEGLRLRLHAVIAATSVGCLMQAGSLRAHRPAIRKRGPGGLP